MAVVSSISRVRTSEPFELQVSRGQISYHNLQFKFGYNAAVGNSKETIWSQGGLYTYLSTASTLYISSSSTADTAAGTGARNVTVFGLDADWNEVSVTVDLNGYTGVQLGTASNWIRVNRIIVNTAGTGGQNAGVLYVGTEATPTLGVPTNKYATVAIGDNQTLMCLWTVPVNYTAFLVKMALSTGTSTNTKAILNASLVVRPYGGVFQTKERFTLTDGVHDQLYVYPTPFIEKSDIEMRAFSSSSSVDFNVSSSIEFVYIKNDSLI